MSGKKENVQSSGITRRDFVKGLAIGAAGLGIATILPGGIITAASAADTTTKQQVGKQGDGIYIDGVAENMKSKTYTLEFVQPIKLVAVKDGKVQSEGTWRTTNKHLVSVDPDGTTIMRDGVGGYDVEISWTLGSTTYAVTLHTGQTAGAHAIEVDHPMTRGDFMIRLAKYFGWPHYNAVMDDGTDINDKGEVMTTERVRNFYDVTGDNDYVKAIESALDMGVLTATSPEDCFYPMSEMTREDAAVILVSAFKMSKLGADYISKFDDTNKIDKNCYDALNILVGRNFMRGRSNTTLNPTDGITDTEARIIIDNIDRRVVCPVWAMPVSNRKFVRVRPEWFTSTQDAVVHWRCKVDKYSHPELNGLFVQDRGVGVYVGTGWSDWYDYIPGYSTDPCFGLNNNKDLPYDATWLIVDVECYATKPGMEDSPVTKFMWRIERPAWHDFAFDKLHDAGENFPAVYRYFDNFQAAAYYIEGSKMGILYRRPDAHQHQYLTDRPGEGSGDQALRLRAGPQPRRSLRRHALCLRRRRWTSTCVTALAPPAGIGASRSTTRSTPAPMRWSTTEKTGSYTGDKVHLIDEGYVFDLGNCKFEVVHLPGHEDASILIYDRANGLLFSSDIYAVNRYWVADQYRRHRSEAGPAPVPAPAADGHLYQGRRSGQGAVHRPQPHRNGRRLPDHLGAVPPEAGGLWRLTVFD